MDYKVWSVIQQRVYECRMNSVDELKLRLIDVWNSLQQNVIDEATKTGESNWEHACMQMDNILNIYKPQSRFVRLWLDMIIVTESMVAA